MRRASVKLKSAVARPRTGKAGASVEDPLAGRIRILLAKRKFTEQKMFGGICFMLGGNMLVGASKRGLLVRVGKDAHAAAVKRAHARPMEMRGRAMEGYIYVDPPGTKSDKELRGWLDLAAAYVGTLPPKTKTAATTKNPIARKGAAARARS